MTQSTSSVLDPKCSGVEIIVPGSVVVENTPDSILERFTREPKTSEDGKGDIR